MKNPYSFAFRSTDMVWSIHSSSYFPGPACSIASHVKMYRNVLYPQLLRRVKCVSASCRENGLFTKETLSPSKNFSDMCEGRSGVAGSFASAAQLIPWSVTSRFWGSRNVRPSMRNLICDMVQNRYPKGRRRCTGKNRNTIQAAKVDGLDVGRSGRVLDRYGSPGRRHRWLLLMARYRGNPCHFPAQVSVQSFAGPWKSVEDNFHLSHRSALYKPPNPRRSCLSTLSICVSACRLFLA